MRNIIPVYVRGIYGLWQKKWTGRSADVTSWLGLGLGS